MFTLVFGDGGDGGGGGSHSDANFAGTRFQVLWPFHRDWGPAILQEFSAPEGDY